MSTRSLVRNLFPPLDNPNLTIRRRSHADPTLLNDFEMAAEGNGDPPVPDLRTMEELCQPSLNGRGGPIAPISIQATNVGLKNDMIQQDQNSCQFYGLSGDDANKHLDKFLHATQSIKVNGVTDDALHLYLFPHSLTHHAAAWFDHLPRNSINTFEQMAKMFLGKYFPPSMVTKIRNEITNFCQRPDESLFKAWERYKLSIDRCPNHNVLPITQIDTFYKGLTLRHRDTINAAAAQWSESSSSITSSFDPEIVALKAKMAEINKNLMRVLQVNQQVKAVTPNCKTYGSLYSYNDCPATIGQTHVYAAGAYQGGNSYQPQGNRNLLRYPSDNYLGPPGFNQNQNRNNQNQNFQNQNRNHAPGYQALVHQPPIPQPQVVTTNEFANFMKANDAILKNMQTNMTSLTNSNLELKNMFGQFMKMNTASPSSLGTLPVETPTSNSEPIVAPIIDPVATPVSSLKPNQKPLIPYPSRFHDQKLRDKANDQKEKNFQIFKDLDFNISFADSLMPKFGPTNKDKLSELARTPLNEHCSTVFLKNLPEKLGDPGKFLILCDFPGMAECLALVDLGTSINLMPLLVWNKPSLPELSPTCMSLELDDRSISHPVRVVEDVFVKVGTFHFLADFVVVDFDANPRVPLILGRSFLKTGRALIDVFEGELTIRVGKEAITFNLDQTSRYSANYNDMTANRIDVIDIACEENSQEVLGFSNVIASGNPIPYYDPIISTSYLTLTPFGDSDFLLEEVDAFLALKDDATLPEVNQSYFESGGYSSAKTDKPSIDEPPEVELRDLPPHLKYVFLEGDDKLPVIITKDLSNEEKTALTKVTFKFPSIRKIKKKPHSRVLTEHLPAVACLSAYAMHRARFKVEKSHFMVKEGIILGHKISKNEIEVDKAKVDVIAKLPHPTTVKGVVLGQRQEKHFRPIHYASKTMTEAESNYTTTEKEMLAMVYALEKFRSYLIMNKSIVHTDHNGLKYLFAKKDSKERLLRWVLVLQEIKFKVIDTKGAENLAADHLSQLENPHQNVLDPMEINENFPLETLNMVSFRGPFPSSPGNKYILLATDYLSKWVKAKTLPTNDARVVCKFLKSLFTRFGTPRAIISDHGMYFFNDQFAKVMLKYGVTHCLATAYHPQTSGQVEVSNCSLKRILKRIVGENRAS
nr:reverse transcriptase domain-containing protein [Tanacetum cinerariifolium]